MWLYQNRNIWRVAIIIVSLAALVGPWFYDKIYVPAKYPCASPVIRLDGDYCGVPVSGGWFVMAIIGRMIELTAEIVTGETAISDLDLGVLNFFLFAAIAIIFLLPAVNTGFLVSRRGGKDKNVVQMVFWGLACSLSVFWAIIAIGHHWSWGLWGILLYTLAVLSGLALEVFVLVFEGRMGSAQTLGTMTG
jgi:hypothetical protein